MTSLRAPFAGLLLSTLLGACAAVSPDGDTARAAVFAAERAFARSMAERDLAAFAGHLSAEAVFIGGEGAALDGREAVIEAWSAFFEGPDAPFSWEPDQVEVLGSRTLALSTGPVRGPDGSVIARFTTIWRWEGTDGWRVVFDRGCPVCADATP